MTTESLHAEERATTQQQQKRQQQRRRHAAACIRLCTHQYTLDCLRVNRPNMPSGESIQYMRMRRSDAKVGRSSKYTNKKKTASRNIARKFSETRRRKKPQQKHPTATASQLLLLLCCCCYHVAVLLSLSLCFLFQNCTRYLVCTA